MTLPQVPPDWELLGAPLQQGLTEVWQRHRRGGGMWEVTNPLDWHSCQESRHGGQGSCPGTAQKSQTGPF